MDPVINGLVFFLICAIGFFDIWLIGAGEKTISQRYQALFPTWVDVAILVPLAVGITVLPLYPFIKVALGVISGHLFWPNKERHVS